MNWWIKSINYCKTDGWKIMYPIFKELDCTAIQKTETVLTEMEWDTVQQLTILLQQDKLTATVLIGDWSKLR